MSEMNELYESMMFAQSVTPEVFRLAVSAQMYSLLVYCDPQ